MSKVGRFPKIVIGLVVALALLLAGGLIFPVPKPDVHLAANYGGEHLPEPFLTLGPIYVTNTLIASWFTIIVLFVLFYFATRKMKLVPTGLQNLVEFAIEMLLNFVEGVAGHKHGRRFFPVIATIFLFVVTNAWLSLLPIFNVIGRGHTGTSDTLLSQILPFGSGYSGTIIDVPLLRSANTDINVPLMLALVSFVSVEYWGVTSLGVFNYLGKFFRFGDVGHAFGQLMRGRIGAGASGIFFGFINVFVGGLELLSEFVRLISFTFRLFGNMTAGEVLLLLAAFLVPWLVPSLAYGLEFMIGFIQALIFGGLTLVFATVAVSEHGSEEEH